MLYVRDDLKDLALYIKSSNEKAKISLEGVSDSQVGEFNADVSLPLDQKEIKKVITVVATDNTKKNYDLVISRENRVARLDEVAVNDTVIEYKNGAYTAYLDESAYPTMENATAKVVIKALLMIGVLLWRVGRSSARRAGAWRRRGSCPDR